MSEPATDQFPPCPECGSEYTYESGSSIICPMCGHEWVPGEAEADAEAAESATLLVVGSQLIFAPASELAQEEVVAGRGGALSDVAADLAGVALGVAAAAIASRGR